ncbi:VirB3 family type IV secretion system protein [Variovorax paradoxus]|uniref:Type IV secretory pathway, VirB3-like protein n=1 Tax=Variovorax paradoxus TaxID=34073 RepID=A0A0H2LXV5_VARPD|nr:VirB3 family type IV secretion system protein [Variovorax paradoxus]KLN53327.1 type IV secretory pathway, VirB3-like protein [Variovorax paradoxus]
MSRNQGIAADPLFVGMTRPSMVWGVTYSAMMFNIVVTTESFIVTKSCWRRPETEPVAQFYFGADTRTRART